MQQVQRDTLLSVLHVHTSTQHKQLEIRHVIKVAKDNTLS